MNIITNWKNRLDVNTGRQNELDDSKGFLMIGIVLIHAFQAVGNGYARSGTFYKILFGSFMVTGACLYLFSMGFGMAYTKKNTAKDMGKNGVFLLLKQLLCNISYAALLFIPLEIWKLFGGVSKELETGVFGLIKSMLLFVNIFFIAGMIYLVMAILKKLKLPLWGYLVIAIVTAVLSPLMAQLTTGNAYIDFLLDMIFGSSGKVSFCFFPYISFVCTGYVLGMVLRKVKNKARFYQKGSIITGTITLVAAVIFFLMFPTPDEKYSILVKEYLIADIGKLIVSDAVIFLLLAALFWARNLIEKWKWLSLKIRFIAKHTSKYYAIHIGVYEFCLIFTAYRGLNTLGCVLLFFPIMFVTDFIVKRYVKHIEKATNSR